MGIKKGITEVLNFFARSLVTHITRTQYLPIEAKN
jgi:hypothetical protein